MQWTTGKWFSLAMVAARSDFLQADWADRPTLDRRFGSSDQTERALDPAQSDDRAATWHPCFVQTGKRLDFKKGAIAIEQEVDAFAWQ